LIIWVPYRWVKVYFFIPFRLLRIRRYFVFLTFLSLCRVRICIYKDLEREYIQKAFLNFDKIEFLDSLKFTFTKSREKKIPRAWGGMDRNFLISSNLTVATVWEPWWIQLMTCRILRAEEDVFVFFHLISVVDPKLYFFGSGSDFSGNFGSGSGFNSRSDLISQ